MIEPFDFALQATTAITMEVAAAVAAVTEAITIARMPKTIPDPIGGLTTKCKQNKTLH